MWTYATLMKAAFPPYRKDLLRTCNTKVRYWRGSTGMAAHREKSTHCTTVTHRDNMAAFWSASLSLWPATHENKHKKRRKSINSLVSMTYTDQP